MPEVRDIKRLLEDSFRDLLVEDAYLMEHNVHEQTISGRLACIMTQKISYYGIPRDVYNVDCEYNKNMDNLKIVPSSPNGAKPDIIIHKRGDNYPYNLLVIELKKNVRKCKADINKVKDFIDRNGSYRYKLGAYICLKHREITFFEFGSDSFRQVF